MTDLYYLHLANCVSQSVWWILLLCCMKKSPSLVRTDSKDLKEYERALTIIGQANNDENLPYLCHTCRVVRPLRSKHCQALKRCVNKFDHYCPFVSNTIGRDNYKYFIGLLFMYEVCAFLWETTATYYILRVHSSGWIIAFGIYTIMWILLVGGLLFFHSQLLIMNLTTNEYINISKYPYFKNPAGFIDNPFSSPKTCTNVYDGLCPSTKVFYSREEVTGELLSNTSV